MRLPRLRVRRLRSQELRQAALLLCGHRLFRRYGMNEEKATKLLRSAMKDRGSEVWAAVRGDEILGFAWLQPKAGFARSAYLRLISVAAAARGFGVGSLLMEQIEKKHLRPNGIFILTSQRNREAQRFYERLGYKRLATLKNYVRQGIHEFLYFKN